MIETDVWVTADEELVISHDINTKRIFCQPTGEMADFHILNSTYDQLRDLQTIESGEKLLIFKDVLKWFVDYVTTHESGPYKLMLDIKKFNPAKIVKLLVQAMLEVKDNIGWWLDRVSLGIWDIGIVKYLNQDPYFQVVFNVDMKNAWGYEQFDIFHISVSWRDTIHYINYNSYVDSLPHDGTFRFKITGVSIIYLLTWSASFFSRFLPLLKYENMKLYTWTINTYGQFDFLMALGKASGLSEYGIITDYPNTMVSYYRDTILSSTATEDDDLVNEITRLTTTIPDDFDERTAPVIQLSIKQKLIYLAYKGFNYIGGVKRVTEEELQFDSIVDENKISPIKVNPVFIWIFATCQKYGLF